MKRPLYFTLTIGWRDYRVFAVTSEKVGRHSTRLYGRDEEYYTPSNVRQADTVGKFLTARDAYQIRAQIRAVFDEYAEKLTAHDKAGHAILAARTAAINTVVNEKTGLYADVKAK